MISQLQFEKVTDHGSNCLTGHTKFIDNELPIGEMSEHEEDGKEYNRRVFSYDPERDAIKANEILEVVSTGIGEVLEVKVKFRRSRDEESGKITPDYVKLQATASQGFPVMEKNRPYLLRPPVYSTSNERLDTFASGDIIYVVLGPHADDLPFGTVGCNGHVEDISSVGTMLTFDISVEEKPNNVVTRNGIVTADQGSPNS
jgi:hypothetical protein